MPTSSGRAMNDTHVYNLLCGLHKITWIICELTLSPLFLSHVNSNREGFLCSRPEPLRR
jgi:hypothetical protein